MNLNDKLKYLRNLNNISQLKLAELSGVSIESIKNYETNKSFPMFEQILKIAEVLNISPNYLDTRSTFDMRIDTAEDLLVIIVSFVKNKTLSISGIRNKKGYLESQQLYLSFNNKKIANIFSNNSLDKLIELNNPVYNRILIEWEFLFNKYEALKNRNFMCLDHENLELFKLENELALFELNMALISS